MKSTKKDIASSNLQLNPQLKKRDLKTKIKKMLKKKRTTVA